MKKLSRREFLQVAGALTTMMGLPKTQIPAMAKTVEQLYGGAVPVIWLQGQSCSGCSVSFLNTENPGVPEILTRFISVLFHSTLMTATGKQSVDVLEKSIEKGGYILVAEGSVPKGMPRACILDEKPYGEVLAKAARRATAILAVGACSSFGGIPAAEGNPTGAISTSEYLKEVGINTPVVKIPGCPVHPEWLVGTIAFVLSYGLGKLDLDPENRPTLFFGRLLHDQCPRFADYEKERFAMNFSDDGCLFKLGCLGPKTNADCSLRFWNNGTNTCIKAGGPCIGCAWDKFARDPKIPFYTSAKDSRSR